MSRGRQSAGAWRRVAAAAGAVTIAMVACVAVSARVSAVHAEPAAHYDPAEGTSPLDLQGARFGQIANGDLSLVIRTQQPWQTTALDPRAGHDLCVSLRRDLASAPAGRICVVANAKLSSGVSLRYTVLDHAGRQLGIRPLSATVRRPTMTTVSTEFSPSLLQLVPGTYRWQVSSLFAGVLDQLPNKGELSLRIAISTAPEASLRCFGAAARSPTHRCDNPKLQHAVVPTPDDAALSDNSPCVARDASGLLDPCEFGVASDDARATIALVGDSHASQWRAALELVAQAKRWHGISITRSGCPFSRTTTKIEPPSRRAACVRWNAQVPKWFAHHPEIHTVFVSDHAADAVVIPAGSTDRRARVAGFKAAWNALPATVKRIVVIRDTPVAGYGALDCVRGALAKHRNPGSACARPRAVALKTDASVIAARSMSPRVRVVDLTPFMCSATQCFPVVGGALVDKDQEHFTDVFAYTLGPYLQRAIDHLN